MGEEEASDSLSESLPPLPLPIRRPSGRFRIFTLSFEIASMLLKIPSTTSGNWKS